MPDSSRPIPSSTNESARTGQLHPRRRIKQPSPSCRSLRVKTLNPAILMLRFGAKMVAAVRKSPLAFFDATARLPQKYSKPYRLPNPGTISPPSNFGRKGLSGAQFHCRSLRFLSNSGDMGRPGFGFGPKGFDFVRFRAVSGGGFSGDGGGYGGLGDGGSGGGGGGGEEGGKSDWFFLSWYLKALETRPVVTKSITSAFLTLIGDLICQLVIDQVSKLDLHRTFVFTFLGLVLVGPTLHFWYLSLSKLVTLPGTSGVFLRLLLDQFVFSPIFIGVFLCALVTLEGRPSQVVPKLQQEWFSSVLANWQLWIPFQFLNFRFVPQNFQVLAANVVALVWNVILSFKAHKEVIVK